MNRRLLAASIGGAAVLVLAWWALLWTPQSSALHRAAARDDAARQRQASLRVTIAALRRQRSSLGGLQATRDRLAAAMPDGPDLPGALDQLAAAAAGAGTDWQSVTPVMPTASAAGGVSELRLSMQVGGSYFQLMDLVRRLDALPRLVTVDGLSMAGASGADRGRLSAQLSARMYYRPSPDGHP